MKKPIKRLLIFIAPVILAVLIVLIEEPIKHLYNEYFSREVLSYKVLPLISLTKADLQDFSTKEGIQMFKMNLDDPILHEYYIVKVVLKNEGVSIRKSLKFNVSFGDRFVKIIDIQHKVISPEYKQIRFSHSIPNLTWSFEES